jgi:hypothetical protein
MLAVQAVEKVRAQYSAWALRRLQVLNQDLERLDVSRLVNHAQDAAGDFERRANVLLADFQGALKLLAERVEGLERELAAFRSRHRLERLPRPRTVSGLAMKIALLVFLIVVEGACNAFFFAQGLWSGLVGGFLYAALFAAVNVAIACVLGNLARNLNHVDTSRKLAGAAAILVALAAAFALALLVAHFRDAMTGDSADPAAAALQRLLAHPLRLQATTSWFLLALTCAFAAVAFVDGYAMDDPYPGYGAFAREVLQAKEDFDEALAEARDGLEGLKATCLAELGAYASRAKTHLERQHETMEAKAATERRLALMLEHTQTGLDAMLATFRDANLAARRLLPRPAYFDRQVPLTPMAMPDFGRADDAARYAAQHALVAELGAALPSIRAAIQASFTRHLDAVLPLSEHFAPRTDHASVASA